MIYAATAKAEGKIPSAFLVDFLVIAIHPVVKKYLLIIGYNLSIFVIYHREMSPKKRRHFFVVVSLFMFILLYM